MADPGRQPRERQTGPLETILRLDSTIRGPVGVIVSGLVFVAASVVLVRTLPAIAVGAAFIAALGFILSERLLSYDRWWAANAGLVGLLVLIVGAGFAFAVGFTALELLGAFFPVSSTSKIPPRGLQIVSATLVAITGSLAVIGALATATGSLSADRLDDVASIGRSVARVPGSVAVVLVVLAALFRSPDASVPAGDPIVPLLEMFLAPAPDSIHVFSFAGLLLLVGVGILMELVASSESELSEADRDRDVSGFGPLAPVVRRPSIAVGIAVALAGLEVVVPSQQLSVFLPEWVAGVLRGVTASSLLRYVLVILLFGIGISMLRRRASRAATDPTEPPGPERVLPTLSGILIVVLAILAHGYVLDPITVGITERLPTAYGSTFETHATAFIDFYGPVAITLLLVTAALWVGWTLTRGVRAGSRSHTPVGPALATGGLFFAAAFASGAGVSHLGVLGGILVAIVGWDVLSFEAEIRREGPAGTVVHRPTLVHAAGSTVVGGIGIVGSLLAFEFAPDAPAGAGETVSFALVALAIGAGCLLLAQRW